MDSIKSAMGGSKDSSKESSSESGGLMDKVKSATGGGGGKEGEKKGDSVDKGVDFVQEHALGQGSQDNESAAEQAKDDKIADFVRGQYKSQTGKDIPGSQKSE